MLQNINIICSMKKVYIITRCPASDLDDYDYSSSIVAFTSKKRADQQADLLNELAAPDGLVHRVLELNLL